MKNILKLLIVSFTCTIICTGCRDINEDENTEIYPVDIITTDYKLPPDVDWQNLKQDSVYQFDSKEKLISHISNPTDIPEIDFERYSLIIVCGRTTNGIQELTKQLTQTSRSKYELKVNITLYNTMEAPRWVLSILTPKIPDKSQIDLTVEKFPKEFVPIGTDEDEFIEYSLPETFCQWTDLTPETVIIINNDEEMKKHVVCTDGSYPAIDFNQYSLIVVHGWTTYGIKTLTKSMRQLSMNEYELNISITLYYTASADAWYVAVLMPKLPSSAKIILSKDEHH